jgi:hypothetical protein
MKKLLSVLAICTVLMGVGTTTTTTTQASESAHKEVLRMFDPGGGTVNEQW